MASHHGHSHAHGDAGHTHSEPSAPLSGSDITHAEANRQHFNKTSNTYDAIPGALELSAKTVAAMLKACPVDEDNTVIMDYACGTGLISQNFAPHVKTIVGVDVSEGMVQHYNTRVGNQGIPAEEMRAVHVELKERPAVADPDVKDQLDGIFFDAVVCAQAYHHFADIAETTRVLTSYLKPGTGVLLVADMIKTDQTVSAHESAPDAATWKHVVAHKGGFTESEMRAAFTAAGLERFEWIPAFEFEFEHSNELVLGMFLAKGYRPASS